MARRNRFQIEALEERIAPAGDEVSVGLSGDYSAEVDDPQFRAGSDSSGEYEAELDASENGAIGSADAKGNSGADATVDGVKADANAEPEVTGVENTDG